MLALLMLLAADPETAVDAERAFNAAAQARGQWTAFREFMTDDAVVFTPQPVRAKESLPQKNPRIAVQWWPAESYVSCDGTMAVNTGPWVRPNAAGYFTTVWVRQADGHFKWVMDGGDALATPRALPEKPKVVRASCAGGKTRGYVGDPVEDPEQKSQVGFSNDRSLAWEWRVTPAGKRTFKASLWNGSRYEPVIVNEIAAPAK